MDLQEDLVNKESAAATPGRFRPVVHAVLQFVVDAAEEESEEADRVQMAENGSSSPEDFSIVKELIYICRLRFRNSLNHLTLSSINRS